MKMNLPARLAGSFVLVLCALMYCETADAGGRLLGRILGHGSSGGSWGGGGSGGSWGSHGGSNGGSFGSSRGGWGSRGGSFGGSLGSRGGLLGHGSHGSRGGLFRNGSLGSRGGLFRHGSHGSRGGSWGSGSSGGSTGGWSSTGGWYGGSTGMVVGGGSTGGYHSGVVTSAPMTYSNGVMMDSSMMTAPGYQTMDLGMPAGQAMPGSIMGPVDSNIPFDATVQPPVYDSNPLPVEQGAPAGGGEVAPTPGAAPADTRYVPQSLDSLEAVLEIRTDLETKIYINDKLTRTPGEVRNYVSRNLTTGQTYAYHIRAELEREGDVIVREQTVELAAGIHESVEFDFDAPPTTTLAIEAPVDATIVLCGSEVAGTGNELRMFSTESLKDGESWENYDIVVSVERDGRTVTQEKTISLSAGETLHVEFDMETEFAVAAR
ncbi:MAG: TIGR03000 domain-containing protein [Planctomycetota bacterium]